VQLKYQKIVIHIKKCVVVGLLKVGDPLPSINKICSEFGTARETVVKAYKILKDEGLIESKPGKGFFLTREDVDYKPSIFLLLNSLNPYMELFYNAFKDALNNEFHVDVYFHHYNIDVFKSLIAENRGKYQSYVVKPFIHNDVPEILATLSDEYLLQLDRDEYLDKNSNYICQDFSRGLYSELNKISDKIKKFSKLYYIHSSVNPHPQKSEDSFTQFATENKINSSIVSDITPEIVSKGSAFIVLSDTELIKLLTICKMKTLTVGADIGIISYNDTPMNEFISTGITSISVDFEKMGEEAAENSKVKKNIQKIIPTRLIVRNSI